MTANQPKESGGSRRHHRSIVVAIASLSLLTSPALAAAVGAPPNTDDPASSAASESPGSNESRSSASEPLPHELYVEIIETTYALLEKYAEGPVTSLSFSLSDFETVPRERFGEIPYRAVATLPEGRVIDVTPSRVRPAGTDINHVRYIPRWSSREQVLADFPEGVRMLTVSLAEALDEIVASDQGYGEVYAFTRYNVVAHLNGQNREYVAAFLWLEAEAVESWSFRVLDHVTQGVAEAAVEDLPTVTAANALRLSEAQSRMEDLRPGTQPTDSGASPQVGDVGLPPNPVDGGCTQSQSIVPKTAGLAADHGHVTGNHSSNASFRAACSCNTVCLSQCDPALAGIPTCAESESAVIWSACHKLADSQGLNGSSTGQGETNPVSCQFGYGCVYKPCLFCGCGLSVSVSILGAQVSFATSGDPSQTMNVQWSHQCPLCESDPEDPPGGPPAPSCDLQPCSPIVIDMLGDGFRFTSGPNGVDFDILRLGYPLRVAWTAVGGEDLFLARDWDSDEAITDGGELFGNRTAQPKTDRPNGYNALAQHDTKAFGGNQDGKIDRVDAIYANLWVWHDRNHNGISEWDELYSMEQAGIDAIYLDYWRSKERDRYGNQLRYFGRVCLSPRDDTLAAQLVRTESPQALEGFVLDPLGSLLDAHPDALADTDCEGRIVQSTDVFFVGGESN